MKKRWLSLIMLFSLGLGVTSGCSNDVNGPVSYLNVDGNDIVLKIGDKTYSANELFADMESSSANVEKIYKSILKMIVENASEDDPNIDASWELLLESFENNVESTAASSGISKDEARKQLLTEEGYSSVEEKKEAYYYDVKLSKLKDEYWDKTKNSYYEEYLTARMPYYVKHVLVNAGYTSTRSPYSSVIETSQATALYKVYEMLANDYKFSYIMNQLSEDGGSSSTGTGYHMDITTSFVSEFLHGVFTFDALLKGKTSEVMGITESASLYASKAVNEQGYNFGIINASDIVALGDYAANTDDGYKAINTYEKEEDAVENKNSITSSSSSLYSGTDSIRSRTIIFNQTFNNAGINLIAYDLDAESMPKNVKKININGVDKNVLTDENGNYVFVVCAPYNNKNQIHFLTVNVSTYDENLKLFFSMDQKATINEMVAEKENMLKSQGKTDAEITSEITEYRKTLEDYKTYVDIKGGEKQVNRNKIIDELELSVKAYAVGGTVYNGEIVGGNNAFLTYDMVEYYMNEGDVTIANNTIKELVENYIANQKYSVNETLNRTIVDGWNDYYNKISLKQSEVIADKKVPMECSFAANGNANTLCSYNYETGFIIQMNYTVNGGTMPENYTKYYQIGDAEFSLPTPTKTDYVFEGWYSTSDFKEGTKVEKIDTSRSSTTNKTQLYAKWSEVTGGAQ